MEARNKDNLKSIYKTHIRSILEYSSCVWNSSLTKSNIAIPAQSPKSCCQSRNGIILHKLVRCSNCTKSYKTLLKFTKLY